jgi:hypothetical protein
VPPARWHQKCAVVKINAGWPELQCYEPRLPLRHAIERCRGVLVRFFGLWDGEHRRSILLIRSRILYAGHRTRTLLADSINPLVHPNNHPERVVLQENYYCILNSSAPENMFTHQYLLRFCGGCLKAACDCGSLQFYEIHCQRWIDLCSRRNIR